MILKWISNIDRRPDKFHDYIGLFNTLKILKKFKIDVSAFENESGNPKPIAIETYCMRMKHGKEQTDKTSKRS